MKLIYGVRVRVETIYGIGSNSFFLPSVEFVLDIHSLSLSHVVHPLVHQHVLVPPLGFEVVFKTSAYGGTRWHFLVDTP